MFNALVLDRTDDAVHASVRTLERTELPEGEVLVSVLYSSLNYKDGLAVTGAGKVVRGDYPFVPGIDLVGRVEASAVPAYDAGDLVIATGRGLGEERWGGFSQLQRVPGGMLVRLPEGLSPRGAMVMGTAGLTAMLSVMALEAHGVAPDDGEVVVTGASGGVGSMAVALLARLGYPVVASTGSADAYDYLKVLGAAEIIPREQLGGGARRPLDSARWAGAVDCVGGATLAAVLSQLGRHASVAACGLAGGHALETTVFPFILRGVNLLGIDSNYCPDESRQRAWRRLAAAVPEETLDEMNAAVVSLADVPRWARAILKGDVRGRVVVDVNA